MKLQDFAYHEVVFSESWQGIAGCHECDELQKEAGEPPLIHLESKECKKCGIVLHRKKHPLPPEGGLAWRVYQALNGPAVREFGLQMAVFDALNLDMDRDEFMVLVEYLNALETGVVKGNDAMKENK